MLATSFPTLSAVTTSAPTDDCDWIAILDEGLPSFEVTEWASTPRSGAVVAFSGIVRDHAEGRAGVHAMTYEAYLEPALERMRSVVASLRSQWPDVDRVALLHRVGELQLSEVSVLVVVSSPHRDAAFEAARFAIDTLKVTVPIWKKEHFDEGSAWGLGAHEVRHVSDASPATTMAG